MLKRKVSLIIVTFVYILLILSQNVCKKQSKSDISFNNILLITIDTIRFDRLSCYGYNKKITPNIDALAEEGIIFKNAFSQVPLTLPSHTSILTGLLPHHHGVRNNGYYVFDKTAPTLANLLKKNDYTTAAFVSSYVLNKKFGLDYGFDYYNDEVEINPEKPHHMAAERKAAAVTDKVLDWINNNADRKFFIWLHYYDPHKPYSPPSYYSQKFKDPYDGEIAYVDYNIGRLTKHLKQIGLMEKTLIVIVGDHGEAFGEHDEIQHGIFLYDVTLHIPFIIHFPKYAPHLKVNSLVRTVDIFPTLLELAGISHYRNDGVSLTHFITKDNYKNDVVSYAETIYPSTYKWASLFSIRNLNWKFIDAPIPELYNITSDISENDNVINSYPSIAQKLKNQLTNILTEQKSSKMKFIDKESQEKLMALGYAGSSLNYENNKNLPDPKFKIAYWGMINKAQKLSLTEPEKALSILIELHQKDKDTPHYAYYAALIFKKAKQYDKALYYIKQAIERDYHNDLFWYGAAYFNFLMSQFQEAMNAIQTCIKINPDLLQAYNLRGNLFIQLNNFQAAWDDFNKVITLDNNNDEAYANIGNIFFMMKNFDKADEYYQRALQNNPKNADALNGRGAVFLQRKDYKMALDYFKKALNDDPTFYEMYINIAIVYISIGNYAEAKYYLQKLMQIMPPDKNKRLYKAANDLLSKIHG